MEKQYNELQEIIAEAYRKSEPRKLAQIIKLIYGKANLRKCEISKNDLEKLNKLGLKVEDLESSFLVGIVYNLIFSYKLIQIGGLDPDGVLTMVNVLLPIYEKIPGTILARRLVVHIKNLLITLIKRPELGADDKTQIFDLLSTPSIKQDNIYSSFDHIPQIREIQDLFKSQLAYDKVTGAMNLINAFSLCSDIEEQLDVFTKRLPDTLKKGVIDINEKGKDFLELIGHIADCMLFQTEYLVKINKEALKPSEGLKDSDPLVFHLETEPPNAEEPVPADQDPLDKYDILSYRLSEQEYILKACDNIYPAISFIIETFLKFPKQIEIQKACAELLERLFYTFPKTRKSIEGHIISVLSNINEDPSNNNKIEASTFLYKLIHRDADPEFKQHLVNRESFQSLYKVPYYDPCVLINKENIIEAVDFKDVVIRAGFPNVRNVPAGAVHTTYIEVWKPFSILYWSFILADYDISFTLTRMASFDGIFQEKTTEPNVVYKREKVEASKHHCRGTFLVKEPGIFRLDFDNTHSWFTAKDLKYVTFVLDPDFRPDAGATGAQAPASMELDKESSNKSESHYDPEGHTPTNKVLSAYGGQSDIQTSAIIYVNPTAIEFSIKNKNHSHEIMVSYRPEEVDWNQINERILETVKKIVEVGRSSFENKVFLRVVYDEKALKGIFKDSANTSHQKLAQKLLASLTCLEKLQANLNEPIEVKNQIDFVMERLLESKHFGPNDNVYAVCANHLTKSFQSKYRSKNKETKGFDFNNLCFPDTTGSDNNTWQLKSVSELYFESELPAKQISYLASLLINISNFYGSEITQFIVFEDRENSVLVEENQVVIREIYRSYLLKKEEEGKKGKINEKSSQNNVDKTLEKIKKAPEIVFLNVKVQDYLKL